MTPKALSRDIKFRMWSIKDKFMDDTPVVYKGAPCTIDTEGKIVWMPLDDTVLMQFTGLLDKNGTINQKIPPGGYCLVRLPFQEDQGFKASAMAIRP